MSVEKHRDGFRVRRKVGGERRYFGYFQTEEEARQMDVAVADEVDDTGAPTLRAWGEQWLDRREKVEHVRGIRTERSRWRTHVETAPFIDLPLSFIDTEQGEKWIDALLTKKTSPRSGRYHNAKPKPLSRKTVREIVILVRQCLEDAVPRYLPTNPFGPLAKKIKKAAKKRGAEATEDPWTYLTPDEQTRLRSSDEIPEPHRLMIAFSLLSGMREGEQFNLELPDLVVDGDDPHVVVRFGSNGQPPKNGKIRRLPLSDDLLAVCRRWLELLLAYAPENPHKLVFPLPSGARVSAGKHPLFKSVKVKVTEAGETKTKVRKMDLFREVYLPAAGIVPAKRHDRRSVRWHDLRHTAGSSLVAGWWGRRWTLEEVKEYLGHSSILVTQRYAHLGETALKKAVRDTVREAPPAPAPAPARSPVRVPAGGAPPVPHNLRKLLQESVVNPRNHSVGRQGLEPWTYGLKDLGRIGKLQSHFQRLQRYDRVWGPEGMPLYDGGNRGATDCEGQHVGNKKLCVDVPKRPTVASGIQGSTLKSHT